MDEQQVKALYWELYHQFEKLKIQVEAQENKASSELSKDLNDLEQLLTQLKDKATEVGIDVTDKKGVKLKVDNNDNIKQLTQISNLPKDIQNELISKLGELKISDKNAYTVISTLDKYYSANVLNVTSKELPSRLKDFPKNLSQEQLEDLENHYRQAASDTVKQSITQLNVQTASIISIENLHEIFKTFWKNKHLIKKGLDNLPYQYKFINKDLCQLPDITVGPFSIKNINLQFSATITYQRAPHVKQVDFDTEVFLTHFASFGRNTITVNPFSTSKPTFDSSTTLASLVPAELNLGFILLTSQIDFGKFSVVQLADKHLKQGLAKSNLLKVLFKGKANFLKLSSVWSGLSTIQNGIDFLFDKCVLQLSLAGDLEVDWSMLKKSVKPKSTKSKKTSTKNTIKINDIDVDKKDLDFIDDIAERTKKISAEADKLDNLIKKKGSQKEIKKVAENMKGLFKESRDEFIKKIDNLGKGAQTIVKKSLTEAGDKLIGVVGQNTIKTLATKAGRLVPIVGTVMAAYDTVMVIYSIYSFFQQDNWEDSFISIGQWLEDNLGFVD
ncbi:MAG: hypothetical protein GY810_14040 [Aureispira sp.]|nr:hypothetical protein [Aureispira sp.]